MSNKNKASSKVSFQQPMLLLVVFLTGCFFSSTVLLYLYPHPQPPVGVGVGVGIELGSSLSPPNNNRNNSNNHDYNRVIDSPPSSSVSSSTTSTTSTTTTPILQNKRILIAITSFDFSQFPLLEEVLDAYQGLCFAGASKVHIYIYTTVPYTVALIDLLNTRLNCQTLQIFIVLKTPALRLNLVDCHRTLFYEKIDDYDLFIYTEDDILVTPTTVATYLQETKQVQSFVSKSPAEDYNIGIVRYEYNYPPDVVINDKTRHATENVTRVYWEHLWKPLVPKSIHIPENVPKQDETIISKHYVTMDNAHQGMFLATSDLLKAWKVRPDCKFDVIRQRPGMKKRPSQPSEGTQRVWMSSRMLHGKNHCDVKQLIPIRNFNQLTVWHLPNKNYRRVGKKGRIGGTGSDIENEFGTGNEKFIGPDKSLPTAMELHLEMRKAFGYPTAENGDGGKNLSYDGIIMINEIDLHRQFKGFRPYIDMVDEKMKAYEDYVARGGQLVDKDYQNWKWTLDRD